MGLADAFLERFRVASKGGPALEVFADDPDGFGAAIAERPDALGEAFEDAVKGPFSAPVILHEDSFSSAACDRDGAVLVAGDGFADWFTDIDPLSAVVRGLTTDMPRVSLYADDMSGRPVALAAGSVAASRLWPLDAKVRDALLTGKASFAIMGFRPGGLAWTVAARAYGLTRAEALLVGELARTGDLQRAAAARDVAYETARKFVASAMRKTGTSRQTELIRRTLALAAGDIGDSGELAPLVQDLFGLTERQSSLAVLVAHGATRDRAAEILGTSDHRAKADLKVIFEACGVASAVDLSRLMAELHALKGLATACEVTIRAGQSGEEPLRLIPRTWNDGQIAISDHGPPDGRPVLVLHSNVSGRHHPRSFIATLRQQGFRPITVDRAGFGLTDFVPGDPIETHMRDLDDVMTALDIEQAAIVARCTLASLVACAMGENPRISGGVLLWPDPPPNPERREMRMTHRARAIFTRYPELTRPFVRVLTRRTSGAVIEKQWRKACEGIPVDMAVMDDPEEVVDLLRGARQAIQGLEGFLNESLSQSEEGPKPKTVPDARRWTAIFGSGYEKFDTSEAASFWGAALPGGTVEIVEDGVHFLHVTHTDRVISALERAFEA